MGHTDERFVSNGGFGVGEYGSVTNVISSAGQIELASAVPSSAIADSAVTTAKITDDAVTDAKLAEEAAFTNTISLYAATGALDVGEPVYMSGRSSLGSPEVSLAQANDRTKAAQFVVSVAATAANESVSVTLAGELTANDSTTNAVGTLLYLGASAAGSLVTTAPSVMFAQPIGMVTAVATPGQTDGTIYFYPGYSKAVNPAST